MQIMYVLAIGSVHIAPRTLQMLDTVSESIVSTDLERDGTDTTSNAMAEANTACDYDTLAISFRAQPRAIPIVTGI